MTRAHAYVPWREVSTWRCVRCGKCCIIFSVPLLPGEAIELVRKYGPFIVTVRDGRAILASKPNGECVFLSWVDGKAHCNIYFERPLVCRLYPFYVRLRPMSSADAKRAEYVCEDGLKVYVYVDRVCEGVDRGGYPVASLVPRVVKLWREKLGL